jgi:hypothetical protein
MQRLQGDEARGDSVTIRCPVHQGNAKPAITVRKEKEAVIGRVFD